MKFPQPMQTALQRMLADARLENQPLQACPPISLALIAAECLERPFSADEQLRIADFPAYWSVCWPGGLALANFILANPQLVAGKTLMDVGAGSGLVAIAAMLAGASKAIACDLDPAALVACEYNAALNQVPVVSLQDYREAGEMDVICAADLLYDDSNQQLLSDFHRQASSVWLAESRQPDIRHPDYELIQQSEFATEPLSSQPDPYRFAALYRSR
ncbi:class I SAM-dependent methyltransferase [Oceanobacter mangrovi]|uniref:class I SAM-dependent methyltransferase n=1 Tax=Oceanobacter mangrovi TaxID=2862510 RepID=UPI001C8D768B|nr:50S ribosomal protein L11 methyltransferase [Oceanobacter mangrovi]